MTSDLNDQLDHAIDQNDPCEVMALLQRRANPNPPTWHISPLHYAMHLRETFQIHRDAGDTQLVVPDRAVYIPTPSTVFAVCAPRLLDTKEEQKKTEIIIHTLIAYGARIDAKPVNSDDRLLLEDIDLWQDSEFGADVMMSSFYAALKRKEPIPRWNLAKTIERETTMDTDARNSRIYVLEIFEDLQKAVARRLRRPDTPVENFVAANLPAEEKLRWMPSYGAWERNRLASRQP